MLSPRARRRSRLEGYLYAGSHLGRPAATHEGSPRTGGWYAQEGSSQDQLSSSASPALNPHAAGIDIGATAIYVAVPAERDPAPVRCFGTFTQDLLALAHWLRKCGIRTVAMEATGVYREVANVIVLPQKCDKTCCPINSTLRGDVVRVTNHVVPSDT